MNKDLIKALSKDITKLTPVEWAESDWTLTRDVTKWPGKISYKRNPYMKEIANFIMPSVPGEIMSFMKGSQIGASMTYIYPDVGWIIKNGLGNILFMVNDEAGVKRAMQGPINQIINNSGIANLVGTHNVRDRDLKGRRNSGTGDTLKGIKYTDGELYCWSGQAVGKLAQISTPFIFIDEFERFPKGDKNAGSLVSLIEERAKSYGKNRKIGITSTPEVKQTSNIEPIYLKGDQRKYHIPCKKCGEMISLIWFKNVDHLKGPVGVVFERTSTGELIEDTVKYRCQECGDTFTQPHIYDCYDDDLGQWIATAKPINSKYVSYHLSALYAPAGMYDWKHYAQKWCEIYPVGKPIKTDELQTFYNQCLGLTWEEQGREVDVKHLLKNTRNYDIGSIPNALSIQDGNGRIILITCASDLNGKEDDARMDWEIVAWSENGSSYSVDHGSIGTFQRSRSMRHSSVEAFEKHEAERTKWTYRMNQPNNVWDEFKRTIMARVYFHEDGVTSPRCPIFGIDTGGTFKKYGKAFVQDNQLAYALQGKVDNKYTKYDQIKTFFNRSSKIDGLYLVEGDTTKDYLSDQMSHVWNEDMGTDQPSGFMNFPRPEGDKYQYKTFFHEFEGEKREVELNSSATAIGSRWTKKNTSVANHYWDCRCYNIVCREIIADQFCRAAKIPISWENFSNLVKQQI